MKSTKNGAGQYLELVIKVVCRNRKDTGEITNDIKSYESKQTLTPPPSPVATNKRKAPWER